MELMNFKKLEPSRGTFSKLQLLLLVNNYIRLYTNMRHCPDNRKTDHSNRLNRQFLLGFIFSCKIFLTLATNSLRLGIFTE